MQTHRHLVLATDCWLRRMVKGIAYPYHPWGLGGSWLTSPRRWGIDPDADPSADQVLGLRRERMDEVRDVIAGAGTRGAGADLRPSGQPRPPAERPHRAAMPACDPQGGVAAPSVRGQGPRGTRKAVLLIARRRRRMWFVMMRIDVAVHWVGVRLRAGVTRQIRWCGAR